MTKPHKPREEPKLRMEDLENKKTPKKQWPTDDAETSINEESEQFAGILEHPSYIELEEKLTKAEQQKDEYVNQLQRAQADADNVRRRAERDVVNARKYALEGFANDLLPVVDSLERALLSDVSDNEFAQKIHQGIELTMSLLLKTLEKYGIVQVNPLGKPFNPELHQAIATQPSDKDPNIVLEVLQKGYVLNDRLIRPALVVVSVA